MLFFLFVFNKKLSIQSLQSALEESETRTFDIAYVLTKKYPYMKKATTGQTVK